MIQYSYKHLWFSSALGFSAVWAPPREEQSYVAL